MGASVFDFSKTWKTEGAQNEYTLLPLHDNVKFDIYPNIALSFSRNLVKYWVCCRFESLSYYFTRFLQNDTTRCLHRLNVVVSMQGEYGSIFKVTVP
ncbi:hypothetical protein DCC62_17860 [candidate division KSB1 bacterium]|nr:MAG: hypothetical protein DCC62_17860 [candidate division KSB1 bacterium]